MVYSMKKDRIRFLQCSGVYHNQLFINSAPGVFPFPALAFIRAL